MFSNLGVLLQKRLDLIPNLVENVKAYAKYETETLEKVINARSKMIKLDFSNTNNIEEIQSLENELTKILKSIIFLNESYPELKANTSFLELQKTLENIEKEIEVGRKEYNESAAELNIYIRQFPNVLFTKIFRFRSAKLFENDVETEKISKINL